MKGGGIAAIASAAVAVALGVGVLIERWRQRYGGLAGVISFSSKLIAASRAVESEEEHPLVADPLAEKMAGAAAVQKSRKRAQAAPAGSERRYKVGKMAIRTRWFDDQIEAALGMPVTDHIPLALRSPAAPAKIDLPAYVWAHPAGHEPRQLVMLGAGMDSRPWRMKLPADLHWFEVDRADVVQAKRKLLTQLAAEVPLDAEGANGNGAAEASTPPAGSGLARHLSLDSVQHPLRCGSWTAVAADLGDPSWADALLAAGFDPSRPTVWVAEGLLMYLEEAQVRAMLAKMAALSPEGSVFVGLSVTQAVIDRIRARPPAGNLMDTWVFGCPPDPTQFLSECGWQLRLATDRGRQAAALGLSPELCGFPPYTGGERTGDSATSLFIAATPSGAAAAPQQ